MKKIFSLETFIRIVIDGIFLALIVAYMNGWVAKKFAPVTAAEVLKKENFLNAKKEVYYSALNILGKVLANSQLNDINGNPIDTTNRVSGGRYPTELEANICMAQLCIYSENKQIPLTFFRLFASKDSTLKPVDEMQKFVNLLKKDMDYGRPLVDTAYKYVMITRDDAASYRKNEQ